jgi:DUF1365 family protein
MNVALYLGTVFHQRYLPRQHRFQYPFFMWALNLDQIDAVPDLGPWFSPRRAALNRFRRADYLGPANESLHLCVKGKLEEMTQKPVTGEIWGLLNLSSLGLYFSPINFYFGYDLQGNCTHLLAEVSNTPWNERHYYAHDLTEPGREIRHAKEFHVSPFNPMEQEYRWQIEPPGERVRIRIEVSDRRGHIFDATIQLQQQPLTTAVARAQLLKKPLMTGFILAAIYWQALRLYLKKVPYVPYMKKESS